MSTDSIPTDSTDGKLIYELSNGVATITINDPERGNALDSTMRDQLADWFDWASADLSVRVVVLTGAGQRHFCTGANLGGAQKATPPRPEGAPTPALGDTARLIRRGWQRLTSAILDCEKPVIAAVNGTAAGGGAQLVLACDLVLMADTAKFSEVFVKRGIIPDAGGAYLLPRVVGPQLAKELMFFGDSVSAQRCYEIGIANRVVEAAELTTTVSELTSRLATSPTKAISMTKWLLNRSFESSRHTSFEEEAVAQDHLMATKDFHEGIAAFRERRDPEFKGW